MPNQPLSAESPRTGSRARAVRERFESIAPVYDRANRLFSLGLDRRWRRAGVRALSLRPGEAVLDVCGGTGDLAFLAAETVGPAGLAVVCDFSRGMLEAGKLRSAGRRYVRRPFDACGESKVPDSLGIDRVDSLRRPQAAPDVLWVQSDAERLGFASGLFDAVTAGFGIRNLADLGRGLGEMARVLKPGGRLLILEFSRPSNTLLGRLYDAYSFGIMPLEARLVYGDMEPLRYLTASIRAFPPPAEVAAALERAGFTAVRTRPLSGGIVTMYLASKPGALCSGPLEVWKDQLTWPVEAMSERTMAEDKEPEHSMLCGRSSRGPGMC